MISITIGSEIVRLYDRKETAAVLGVRPETVWGYLKTGRLPGQLIGGRWLVTEGNLYDFISGKCATPEAENRLRNREARRRGNLRQYQHDDDGLEEDDEW